MYGVMGAVLTADEYFLTFKGMQLGILRELIKVVGVILEMTMGAVRGIIDMLLVRLALGMEAKKVMRVISKLIRPK